MHFIRLTPLFFLLLLSSCLRLDDNLYNPSNAITEYKRDAFTGNEDFVLEGSYAIPENLIHLFTLNSQMTSEASPTSIYATYIGDINRIATDTVILYCHGNKFHMDLYWQRAKLLANTGAKNRFGVMMLDYRGYGLSKGKSTEESLYTDVDAAMAWLKDKGLTGNRLIIYGFSMGSAPATKLTAQPRSLVPAKLILEAPFASAAVMVQDGAVLAMPASFFTSLKIDNAEQIKNINQPFLWLHGTSDQFLNYKTHGEVIYKNYHGVYGEAHRVANAGHTSVPNTMGFSEYSSTLLRFITQH
jgi:pimeloyl-ACP methyl ester carboxylesterase